MYFLFIFFLFKIFPTPSTYLAFEKLRSVTVFFTEKLNKINKKKFFMYFKTLFITLDKFYINIFHRMLRKIPGNSLFFDVQSRIAP